MKKIVTYSMLFFNLSIIAQNKIINGVVKECRNQQPILLEV